MLSSSKGERLKRLLASAWPYAHFALPAAAGILALCSTHILIGPVLNRSGDNMYHLLNEFALLHGIEAGDNPFGPIAMEFGQPVLRFYQALFYLYNVGVHFFTGISLHLIHNLTIVVCFTLSPFSYLYFLRKIGLNRWAAAIGSFTSMISIAAFGNSFEAYHQAGIVTQSMGGLFFPWFMGHFVGMLRGENRPTSTALLFALAFLSHAIMAVFAVFAGALYFFVNMVEVRLVLKKLLAFAALGACLVAFWVLPFISHTYEMRPVPDSILRGAGVHWFTSVSKSELAMVLTTGRLLDDAHELSNDRDANDKFMDRISIIGTLSTRPPAVTILTALGVLLGLFWIRRSSYRFLIAGFFFSILLFAGPDDFRWLRYLPFMKQIQTFRCTYLVEFFAFGLVGAAVESVLRNGWRLARTRKSLLKHPLTVVWFLVVCTLAGLCGNEIIRLGQVHLHIRNPIPFDRMVDASSTIPNRGYPYRISPLFKGRFKLRHGWFAIHGYTPFCTHWKGTGPSAAYHLCSQLGNHIRNRDLTALAGIRYFSAEEEKAKPYIEVKDDDNDFLFEKLPNGPDRNGKRSNWHYLFDSGREHFLRPFVGKALPVVCSRAQWIWLAKAWTGRYRSKLWEKSTPLPMYVEPGKLVDSGLLRHATAVLYLDQSALSTDRAALTRFAANGGSVVTTRSIPGIKSQGSSLTKGIWKTLPKEMQQPKDTPREMKHREEEDPGLKLVEIKRLPNPSRTMQLFSFDIDALEPVVAILPMEAAPGWQARLDGKPYHAFPTGPDMLGVVVPKGAHRLDLVWEMPRSEMLSLLATLAALAFLAATWIRTAFINLKNL
jgi:hypothetical protein